MFTACWIAFHSQIQYAEVLTLSTLPCDRIWKQSCSQFNVLRWGHTAVQWALYPSWVMCLYKKGKFGHTHTHTQVHHVMMKSEIWLTQEKPKVAREPPEASREAWDRLSLTDLPRNQPCLPTVTLIWNFLPPKLWDNQFLFKTLSCGTLS